MTGLRGIADYLANGGDEVAMLKASLEHTLGNLGTCLEELAELRERNAALTEALRAVIAVADRKTVEFDQARAALAKATEVSP
jgi:hypothetical protein